MRKVIVVDIDGTVADISHRVHHLEQKTPKDWISFRQGHEKDKPIMHIINLVKTLSKTHDIVFCTGREESEREVTEHWLNKNYPAFCYEALLMRPNNNRQPDAIVKPKLLTAYGLNPNIVEFILEDRNSVVKRWRELGYVCLQVADGDF